MMVLPLRSCETDHGRVMGPGSCKLGETAWTRRFDVSASFQQPPDLGFLKICRSVITVIFQAQPDLGFVAECYISSDSSFYQFTESVRIIC